MTEFIRCTALTRIVFGSKHWRVAKAHSDLAAAYFDLKGWFVKLGTNLLEFKLTRLRGNNCIVQDMRLRRNSTLRWRVASFAAQRWRSHPPKNWRSSKSSSAFTTLWDEHMRNRRNILCTSTWRDVILALKVFSWVAIILFLLNRYFLDYGCDSRSTLRTSHWWKQRNSTSSDRASKAQSGASRTNGNSRSPLQLQSAKIYSSNEQTHFNVIVACF